MILLFASLTYSQIPTWMLDSDFAGPSEIASFLIQGKGNQVIPNVKDVIGTDDFFIYRKTKSGRMQFVTDLEETSRNQRLTLSESSSPGLRALDTDCGEDYVLVGEMNGEVE